MIKVKSQGKTFTFEDGTTTDQIGDALDEYFSGSAKQQTPLSNQSQNEESMSPKEASDFARQALKSVDYGQGAESTLGALGKGFKRGMEEIGEGILQRAYDVKDFFGGDTDKQRRDLELSRKIEQKKYEPTEEEYPVASTVGEIGGSIAAVPVGAGGKLLATGTGAALGGLQYLESGEGRGKQLLNTVLGGGTGLLGEVAAPYLQKGYNKAQSLTAGIFEKLTGAKPADDLFSGNGLSEKGKEVMNQLGITPEDFERMYKEVDKTLDPKQVLRQQRAKEQGIDLTQAQVRRDFDAQEKEQTLLNTQGRSANEARRFAEEQQEQIKTAQDKFLRELGDPELGRNERGEVIQKGLMGEKEEQEKLTRELYKKASETEGFAVPIGNDEIVDFAYDQIMSKPVDESIIKRVESLMAKYGLIGDSPQKKGRFSSIVDEQGKTITFKGDVTPLGLDNAESFRKELNQLRGSDQTGAISQVIKKLDDQVDNTLEKYTQGTERQAAFESARASSRKGKETFNQKDIIQNLTSYKKNTKTPTIDPARSIARLAYSDDGITNLLKAKKILTKKPNNKSIDAWNAVGAQTVADLFSNSINQVTGDVSGARLKTAIKKLGNGDSKEGIKKLKIILGPKYAQFNNLVQSIGDATIPLKGTTNPSGTAYKLINLMQRLPGASSGIEILSSLGTKANDAITESRTLSRIKNPTAEQRKRAKKLNNEAIDQLISLGLQRTLQDQLL